jgi:hypothetical protein
MDAHDEWSFTDEEWAQPLFGSPGARVMARAQARSPIAWESPPLDAEDRKLVDAYSTIGVPVDQLPYTPNFDKICQLLGFSYLTLTDIERHFVFRRLIRLSSCGRLPRLNPKPPAPIKE